MVIIIVLCTDVNDNGNHTIIYIYLYIYIYIFCLGFLPRTFTNHRTAGEEGGHFFNSWLPLPTA